MGAGTSNIGEDSGYINQKKIPGHWTTPLKQIKDKIEKGENAMVKIIYIGVKGSGFFLNKIFHQ